LELALGLEGNFFAFNLVDFFLSLQQLLLLSAPPPAVFGKLISSEPLPIPFCTSLSYFPLACPVRSGFGSPLLSWSFFSFFFLSALNFYLHQRQSPALSMPSIAPVSFRFFLHVHPPTGFSQRFQFFKDSFLPDDAVSCLGGTHPRVLQVSTLFFFQFPFHHIPAADCPTKLLSFSEGRSMVPATFENQCLSSPHGSSPFFSRTRRTRPSHIFLPSLFTRV